MLFFLIKADNAQSYDYFPLFPQAKDNFPDCDNGSREKWYEQGEFFMLPSMGNFITTML